MVYFIEKNVLFCKPVVLALGQLEPWFRETRNPVNLKTNQKGYLAEETRNLVNLKTNQKG